jgi:hypothetical protein
MLVLFGSVKGGRLAIVVAANTAAAEIIVGGVVAVHN